MLCRTFAPLVILPRGFDAPVFVCLNSFFAIRFNIVEGYARNQAHRVATTSQLAGVGVGAAVFDQWAGAVDSTLREDRHTETLRIWDVSTTSKAVGLLHFAAAGGNTEAQLALGLRSVSGSLCDPMNL